MYSSYKYNMDRSVLNSNLWRCFVKLFGKEKPTGNRAFNGLMKQTYGILPKIWQNAHSLRPFSCGLTFLIIVKNNWSPWEKIDHHDKYFNIAMKISPSWQIFCYGHKKIRHHDEYFVIVTIIPSSRWKIGHHGKNFVIVAKKLVIATNIGSSQWKFCYDKKLIITTKISSSEQKFYINEKLVTAT